VEARVGCGDPARQEAREDWPGWCVMEPATTPSPDHDLWNTVGGAIQALGQKIANNITAADVAAIFVAITA
jgi:hypothetical protein